MNSYGGEKLKKLWIKLSLTLLLMVSTLTTAFAQGPSLVIGGDTIAIMMKYDGVLITGMYDFEIDGVQYYPSSTQGVRIKDKIIAVENLSVKSLQDLYLVLEKYKGKTTDLNVTVIRQNQRFETKLRIFYLETENVFKTGLYVKDGIKGVGTLTYYDPRNQSYGALGHEIMDQELGSIAEVAEGEIYKTSVVSLRKSIPGTPGEKIAQSNSLIEIGNISKNTIFGLYGQYRNTPSNPLILPSATRDEIELGEAYIYTVIQGSQIERFKINIKALSPQSKKDIKGISFDVVDERLLKLTGGIVQGMSGSPIIQNNRIIGAVTHMITTKPESGYGVFIEWMLAESNTIR